MLNYSRYLVGACLLVLALPLEAQDSTAAADRRSFARDSSAWRAGVQAGKDSANEPPVALRSVVGFLAGVPSAFFGVGAAIAEPQNILRAALGLGMSLGTLSAAARAGRTTASIEAAAYASSRGPEFERGFRTGYADRLRSRRVRAAVIGGAVGATAALGLLRWGASLD
jgi:hypothetical protein